MLGEQAPPDGWLIGGRAGHRAAVGWWLALAGSVVLLLAGYALAPGSLLDKAHLAVHGLCAQIPSHTLHLGGAPLPFDARMTGLYLGALISGGGLLLARRRGTAIGPRWLVALSGLVVIMGLDGLNSLRADLGWPGWWVTDNRLRLITGLLAGLALGVALVWLVNLALWSAVGPLLRPRDGLVGLAGVGLAGAVTLSGAGWALGPVVVALLGAALLAVMALNLAGLALVGPPRPLSGARLARLLTLALLAAVSEMALLAAGRRLLEVFLVHG